MYWDSLSEPEGWQKYLREKYPDALCENWRNMQVSMQREIWQLYGEATGETLEKRERNDRWKMLCPPLYRETDPARIPARRQFEEVQRWRFGPEGLLLHGMTGTGKTRAMWFLLRRLFLDEERKIEAFDPFKFKKKIAETWTTDEEERGEFISQLCRAEILFLDDFDKVKFTETMAEAFYTIIERRANHSHPTFLTLNSKAEELAERMDADGRGWPIVRRLREFNQCIDFDGDGTKEQE